MKARQIAMLALTASSLSTALLSAEASAAPTLFTDKAAFLAAASAANIALTTDGLDPLGDLVPPGDNFGAEAASLQSTFVTATAANGGGVMTRMFPVQNALGEFIATYVPGGETNPTARMSLTLPSANAFGFDLLGLGSLSRPELGDFAISFAVEVGSTLFTIFDDEIVAREDVRFIGVIDLDAQASSFALTYSTSTPVTLMVFGLDNVSFGAVSGPPPKDPPPADVPEPGALALLGLGVLALARRTGVSRATR